MPPKKTTKKMPVKVVVPLKRGGGRRAAREPSPVSSSEPCHSDSDVPLSQPQQGPSSCSQPQPGPSSQPQPGPSSQPQPGPSPQPSEEGLPLSQQRRPKKKPVVLTEEQEAALAEWLKENPEIFNKGMKRYKDSQHKKKLWDDMASSMNIDPAQLQTWYSSVRTKVGKIAKTVSGQPAKELTERDAFLQATFSFLLSHIHRVKGRTASNLTVALQARSRSRSRSRSSSRTDESQPPVLQHAQPAQPQPADVPAMVRRRQKETRDKRRRPPPSSDSDQEGQELVQQMTGQLQRSRALQRQVDQALQVDRATPQTAFGTFLGKLANDIHPDLLPAFYAESLDHCLQYLRRSKEMTRQAPQAPQFQARHVQQVQQVQYPAPQFQAPKQAPPQQLQQAPQQLDYQQGQQVQQQEIQQPQWDTMPPQASTQAVLVTDASRPTRSHSTPVMSSSTTMGQLSGLSDILGARRDSQDNQSFGDLLTNL